MFAYRSPFPFSPMLIHCLTNGISNEYVANALLAIGVKPIMSEDIREMESVVKNSAAVLLNMGQFSAYRERCLTAASVFAKQHHKPIVIDLVGYAISAIKKQVTQQLLAHQPTVVKGNLSEMRAFCGLATKATGVDTHEQDQTDEARKQLILSLKDQSKQFPNTVFLATGKVDCVVSANCCVTLHNGVDALDQFVGTGDTVGALIAAFLPVCQSREEAVILAVSYFNICAEKAEQDKGLGTFRIALLNQLSKVHSTVEWLNEIKGEKQ